MRPCKDWRHDVRVWEWWSKVMSFYKQLWCWCSTAVEEADLGSALLCWRLDGTKRKERKNPPNIYSREPELCSQRWIQESLDTWWYCGGSDVDEEKTGGQNALARCFVSCTARLRAPAYFYAKYYLSLAKSHWNEAPKLPQRVFLHVKFRNGGLRKILVISNLFLWVLGPLKFR